VVYGGQVDSLQRDPTRQLGLDGIPDRLRRGALGEHPSDDKQVVIAEFIERGHLVPAADDHDVASIFVSFIIEIFLSIILLRRKLSHSSEARDPKIAGQATFQLRSSSASVINFRLSASDFDW
jgi:hypothetical protein